MTKPVSQKTEQYPASVSSPSTIPDSSWSEGDISFRKGNCNSLLIAPHGYEKDDEKTYDITRLAVCTVTPTNQTKRWEEINVLV